MKLSAEDRALVEDELGRPPNEVEEALFVNLWSEHCAYRSSRPLLRDLPSEADHVVVGPGDDAAVVELTDDTLLAMGIESHNHPSYVDPYDGAATGVGGIVRDILSMGAKPVALLDSIYFGEFDREKSRYLFEGVVEGIGDYGNSIGVPTVGGQTYFDESYNGNPLVNVMCVGVVSPDDLLTAELQEPGNRLVLVGSSTGRDGLGGASFASEDLDEDAESEDRPAVQVGDPYTEKLLIDATLEIRDLAMSARDLGAAGLAGASSEMAAKAGLGATVDLDSVHLRERGMNALEVLLSESQERMLFEVRPDDVERVRETAERYDLDSSVIGEVTDTGRYTATWGGETVVDLPAEFLADGAPVHDLEVGSPRRRERSQPAFTRDSLLERLRDASHASKEWVYRQYDHEVQTRTVLRPGDDAAVLDVDGVGVALSAGCDSRRVAADPYEGGFEAAFENAVNVASKAAVPHAMVDCLNFGNPERPDIYAELSDAVRGLADAADALEIPVVGGNVSLYNESEEYDSAVNPTPTVGVVGVGPRQPPRATVDEADEGDPVYLLDVEPTADGLAALAETAADAKATHDVSDGGVAVALAEMVGDLGVEVELDAGVAFDDSPGRVVVVAPDDPVGRRVGTVVDSGLSVTADGVSVELSGDEIRAARKSLERGMEPEVET
ncbi:MAG: phosphoribosylformylglycinamidine synthase subunit PurL [Halobacteriales archaeon]